MTQASSKRYPTQLGYMTEVTQRAYIVSAVAKGLLPDDALRMAQIVSLDAPKDPNKPIQFWQLYSVLGQDPIVEIVGRFYERVFADEDWFTSIFERVGGIGHHINTQASMWVDVMGGGPYYHGAEFRLNFHHTHNAMELMNEKGAARWTQLMLQTLDDSVSYIPDDARIRPSINTFLTHFMGKYAGEFKFENHSVFGDTNPTLKRKINFMNMTTAAIEALTLAELSEALKARGVDVTEKNSKAELVSKAQML